jgi:hypothetical protein
MPHRSIYAIITISHTQIHHFIAQKSIKRAKSDVKMIFVWNAFNLNLCTHSIQKFYVRIPYKIKNRRIFVRKFEMRARIQYKIFANASDSAFKKMNAFNTNFC